MNHQLVRSSMGLYRRLIFFQMGYLASGDPGLPSFNYAGGCSVPVRRVIQRVPFFELINWTVIVPPGSASAGPAQGVVAGAD